MRRRLSGRWGVADPQGSRRGVIGQVRDPALREPTLQRSRYVRLAATHREFVQHRHQGTTIDRVAAPGGRHPAVGSNRGRVVGMGVVVGAVRGCRIHNSGSSARRTLHDRFVGCGHDALNPVFEDATDASIESGEGTSAYLEEDPLESLRTIQLPK